MLTMKAEGRRQKAERLAGLLRYPTGDFHALCHPERSAGGVEGSSPDVEAHIAAFADEIEHVIPEGLEELYTRTFDLNPVATLELGWHLWGEQYERGRFLADLRGLEEEVGIEAESELPDHLTVVLPTIARMANPEALIAKITPALDKIAAPLNEHGNPYRHLLAAVKAVLAQPPLAAQPRNRATAQPRIS